MSTDESQEVIEIRKYSNRRLYDTSASEYVTLADVANIIREGKDIRVVDAKTGEDLTRSVMLQIICESKPEQEALPIGFLRQVIQASSQSVRSSIQEFLTTGLQAQKEVQHQMANWMRLGMEINPLTAPLLTAWEHLSGSSKEEESESDKLDSSASSKPKACLTPQVEKREQDKSREEEIREIQEQLVALQKKISEL